VGAPGDFRQTGFVRIVHPDESERLKLNVDLQRRLGVEVLLIGQDELKELEPAAATADVIFVNHHNLSGLTFGQMECDGGARDTGADDHNVSRPRDGVAVRHVIQDQTWRLLCALRVIFVSFAVKSF
jgi:hypothetical protein